MFVSPQFLLNGPTQLIVCISHRLLVQVAEFGQDLNDHSSFAQTAIVFESQLTELAICNKIQALFSNQFSEVFLARQALSFFDD